MPPPINDPSTDQVMSIINGGSEQRRVRYRQQPDGSMLADTGPDGRPGQTFDPRSGTAPQGWDRTPLASQGGGQQGPGGGQMPYLSWQQILNTVPYYNTPDSNPLAAGYTGVRTAYRDPGLTAAAMNFYNNQQQVQQSADDTSLRRALGFGELAVKRQEADTHAQAVGEHSDPVAAKRKLAVELAGQGLTPAQIVARIGNVDAAFQAAGGARPQFGGPAQPPQPDQAGQAGVAPANQPKQPQSPQQPANAVGVEQQKQNKIGPEVYGWLNQVVPDQSQLQNTGNEVLTNLFRHDRANPGYMQQHGQDVVDMFKKNYGENTFNNFLNPGGASVMGSGFKKIFGGGPSDTEQAQAAFRHYMGKGQPMSWWVNMAEKVNPDLNGIADPHRDIAPIPGSPGAMRGR